MPTTSSTAEYSKSFVSVPIPAGAGEPQTGEPKAETTPPVMTKILLCGGHMTTIHGKSPTDLRAELFLALEKTAPNELYCVLHKEYAAEPYGVAIDPRAVIGLIRIDKPLR